MQGCEPVIINPNGYYAIAKVYEPQIFRLGNRSYAISKKFPLPGNRFIKTNVAFGERTETSSVATNNEWMLPLYLAVR